MDPARAPSLFCALAGAESLDWRTGRSEFTWRIGGQRYNPLFSGTLIDESGRVHYGTPWGRVRLAPAPGPDG